MEEGLIPDKALYEAMIKYHCRHDQLDEGLDRLEEMQVSEVDDSSAILLVSCSWP